MDKISRVVIHSDGFDTDNIIALKIDFLCDNKINLEELESFYFTQKVFKAIIAFSTKMNLSPLVQINRKTWNTFYMYKD